MLFEDLVLNVVTSLVDQPCQVLTNFVPCLQLLLDELGYSLLVSVDLSLFLLEHVDVGLLLLIEVKFNVTYLGEDLLKSLNVL